MQLNPMKLFSGKAHYVQPVLLAVTPPRTGERTLLGVENMLASIAVPEPFSLELAGDSDGITLMSRCLDGEVVRGQIAAHYPQARIQEVPPEDDPLKMRDGEQAWSMTLRSSGPEYVPLRVFRDDDLLDPGSDPLIALLGALSNLNGGERIVSRLMLRSLGPGWASGLQEMAQVQRAPQPSLDQTHPQGVRPQSTGGLHLALLGVGALAAFKGYQWVQAGEVMEGRPAGNGRNPAPVCRWLGLAPLEEVPLPGLRPPAHKGEGLPHRLRRRGTGHGHNAGLGFDGRARKGGEASGARGCGVPPLRPSRRSAVQGWEAPAGIDVYWPAPHRARPFRQT